MKPRLILLTLIIAITLGSCSESNKYSHSQVEKKIYKQVDFDTFILQHEESYVESLDKINDSTYKVVHNFTNPLTGVEMRTTRIYEFDSIGCWVTFYNLMKQEIIYKISFNKFVH